VIRSASFFADGIDFALVALWGIAVLVPLMLFQVAVESGILSRTWRIAFRPLVRPVFVANCWSLLAGIPTMIINAGISAILLPDDLAGYFARYSLAAIVGTMIYLIITILVEGFSLWRWLKGQNPPLSRRSFWLGVILANTASYAVLAPLHYLATRPIHNVKQFTSDTAWANQPPAQIIYIDPKTQHLKSIYSDGSRAKTLVPRLVVDYIVTSNLDLILFSETNGIRYLCRPGGEATEKGNAIDLKPFAERATFGPRDKEHWNVENSSGDWKAWAEPGLGNHLRVYRTNNAQESRIYLGVNPGFLHLPDFQFAFSDPVFISNGQECLFQSGPAIYLLDIAQRRVGKVTAGTGFILITPAFAKSP